MRLAFFSPISPMHSGISDYSDALLPHLARVVDRIDLFIDDYGPKTVALPPNVFVRNYREFAAEHRAGAFDSVVYQMGNNPFHVYIYDIAMRVPGIVVLHEFNLHYLLASVTVARGDWDGYLRELEYDGGAAALKRGRLAQEGKAQLDYDNVSMNRSLLERSRGVLCHSDFVKNLVHAKAPGIPIAVIPHGVALDAENRAVARSYVAKEANLSLGEDTVLFGVFGFLKPYKRIWESLRAFARTRTHYPNIKMILVGEEHPHYPLRPAIDELGVGESVRILGYVPIESFNTCIAASDICMNLRWPTAGETSGSLLRALAHAKPTMISEIGAFLEIPRDAAVRIPAGEREEEWIFEYMRVLLDDRELAGEIGRRGREYAEKNCSWPVAAEGYVKFLKESNEINRNVVAAKNSAQADTSDPPAAPEIEDYIMGFSHASPLMEDYAHVHRRRLARTIQVTPRGTNGDRALELGCYLQMTPALRRFLNYEEIRGGYFGKVGETHYRAATSSSGEVFACPVELFDAEKDVYPYPDGYFTTVLCCELIEHLALDPMHMLAEINRVLKPGGWLILSTPNIVSERSVYATLHGYHPGLFHAYIKPGEDGTVDPRHAREYTPREIAAVMEIAGFHVELLETGNYEESSNPWLEGLFKSHGISSDLRGEIIYCLGRKIGPVRERWPKELYYP